MRYIINVLHEDFEKLENRKDKDENVWGKNTRESVWGRGGKAVVAEPNRPLRVNVFAILVTWLRNSSDTTKSETRWSHIYILSFLLQDISHLVRLFTMSMSTLRCQVLLAEQWSYFMRDEALTYCSYDFLIKQIDPFIWRIPWSSIPWPSRLDQCRTLALATRWF